MSPRKIGNQNLHCGLVLYDMSRKNGSKAFAWSPKSSEPIFTAELRMSIVIKKVNAWPQSATVTLVARPQRITS